MQYKVIYSYDQPDEYELAVGVSKKNYFRKWVQCSKCGFYYSLYSRNKNIIKKIYPSFYRSNNCFGKKESLEKVFKKVVAYPKNQSETKLRVSWLKQNIKRIWQDGLIQKANPPLNFLDIGGGTGVFAYEFQDKLWKAHIVDPKKDGIFIKKKYKISFVSKYYIPHIFPLKFNLISLIYVLEHLLNPIEFLRKLSNDLLSSSFLYIEVPDAICFKYKPREDNIYNSCHLWMFSPITLAILLNTCGFEIFSLKRLQTIRGNYALMVLAGEK